MKLSGKFNILAIILICSLTSGCLTMGTLTKTETLKPLNFGGGVYFSYPHGVITQVRMGIVKDLEMGFKITAAGTAAFDFKLKTKENMAINVLAAFFDSDSKLFEFNAIFTPKKEASILYYGIGAVIPDMHGSVSLGGLV